MANESFIIGLSISGLWIFVLWYEIDVGLHFCLFLAYDSKPMPNAANYWRAHMDRYLILKDEEDPQDELSVISETIEELIEIFYRALNADKSGEEVCFPHRHMYAWMSVCISLPLHLYYEIYYLL